MVRAKRLNSLLLYCVIGILGVFVGFHPTLLSGFSKAQAETGDTRLVHYFLEHSFQVVFNRSYHAELWSPAFFFPFKNTLALSENLFGAAPLYWMLRGILPIDLAYQCWMILAAVLCFIGCVILLRSLRVSHSLAALGSFIFAFGIPRMGQLFHAQLLCQFYTPIAFIFIWGFLRQPRLNQFCFALLFIFLQILAAYYHGWFLLFSLLIFVPIVLWLEREYWKQLLQFLRLRWRSTIAVILVWLGGLIWLFLPYVQMVKVVGGFPFSQVATMIPRVSSWLLPPPNTLWFPLLSEFSKDILDPNQHLLFLGFFVFALVGFAVYIVRSRPEILTLERSTLVKSCLITALILFVLSLDVFGVSIWRIIYSIVPGATAIRAAGRIVYIVEIYVLIAGLLCVDSFFRSTIAKRNMQTAIALSLLLIALSEVIIVRPMSYEKAPVLQIESELQSAIASRCDVAYLVTDSRKTHFYLQQLPIMWAGLKAGVPVINGYSGSTPVGIPTTVEESANFNAIVQWLSGKMQGRLCWIQSRKSAQIAPNLLVRSIQGATQFQSANFTTSVIPMPPNVPLPGFAQAIEVEIPPTLRSGQSVRVPMLIRNSSLYAWFQTQEAPINLSYRWLNAEGAIVPQEGQRTPILAPVAPGETIALNAIVKAPDLPGRYQLRLSLVQENVSWFVDRKAKPFTTEVEITR